MIIEVIVFLVLAGLSVLGWWATGQVSNPYLDNSFMTMVAATVIYFFLKVVFQGIIKSRIKDARKKFTIDRTVSLVAWIIFLFTIVAIWVEDPSALLVAYGLVAAGVAVALQDVFKNIAGGIILFARRPYRAGDRVEIGEKFGEVIDISLMNTTLLETNEWIKGDQSTGRITLIPNSWILSKPVNNYSAQHDYIWDEIVIPITYDSDWKKARKVVIKLAADYTEADIKGAAKALTLLGEQHYVSKRETQPAVFVKLTDNWVEFHLRFVSRPKQRRVIASELSQKILDALEKEKKVNIASETMTITTKKG